MLKLLDLDPSLGYRRYLARILDVHAGQHGSSMQNIALHHAILQELAKNNGQLLMKILGQSSPKEADSDGPSIFGDQSGIIMDWVQEFSESDKEMSLNRELRQETQGGGGLFISDTDEFGQGTMPDSPTNDTRKSRVSTEPRGNDTGSDSNDTEISSIFSEGSGETSGSSSAEFAAADKQFAYMLFTNDRMEPLFQSALLKVSIEKFTRNFRRLISRYGQNLAQEASPGLQSQAAKYVQRSARQVTIHILHAITLQVQADQLSKARQVNDWLESLQGVQKDSDQKSKSENEDQETFSDTDTDDADKDEDMSLQTLYDVQKFLTTANAFEVLHNEFQQWLVTGELQRGKSQETSKLIDTTTAVYLRGGPNVLEGFVGGKNSALSVHPRTWIRVIYRLVYRIQPSFWPRPPIGYKRITWHGALGRPLYIDVKETIPGAAERLQVRFRTPGMKTTTGPSESSSAGTVHLRTPAPPPLVLIRRGPTESTHFEEAQNTDSAIYNIDDSLRSVDERFLLLCFRAQKSDTFKQINVTGLDNDQFLFSRIYNMYCEVKKDECWYSKIPFIKSMSFTFLGTFGCW